MALTLRDAADIIGAQPDRLEWREQPATVEFGYTTEWDDGRCDPWIHEVEVTVYGITLKVPVNSLDREALRRIEDRIGELEAGDRECEMDARQ